MITAFVDDCKSIVIQYSLGMSYWCAHECKYNVFVKDSYLHGNANHVIWQMYM